MTNGVMSTYLPLRGSVRTLHACNSIHYTHRKLIVHILIDFDEVEVERSVACRATAIDRAVFVATDLEKYTSYEDAIKSNM